MKLRYIILGCSLFFWSTLIAAGLTTYFNVDMVLGRPILYIVILASGVLVGYGLGRT